MASFDAAAAIAKREYTKHNVPLARQSHLLEKSTTHELRLRLEDELSSSGIDSGHY